MSKIFEHTDRDGDSVEVHKDQGPGENLLAVTCEGNGGQNVAAYVDKAAVRTLHAVLGKWLAEQNMPMAFTPEACLTQLSEGPCAGTRRHRGDCTANADDIPSEQGRSVSTETRIDEAEETVTNALNSIRDQIKAEHQVDRQHYTSQFGAVVDRIKEMHTDLFRQQSGLHTSATVQRMDADERLEGLLTEIRDRLPEPARKLCGTPDLSGNSACVKDPGHVGRHADEYSSWPVGIDQRICENENYNGGQTCVRTPGHLGFHRNVKESMDLGRPGSVEWPQL